MDDGLAKQLLTLFFKAPLVNALLVFEENDYLGVVLKRDIERGLKEANFELYRNINLIHRDDLGNVLFRHQVTKSVSIPVIDKAGTFVKFISYDEFVSQLYFEKYIFKFDPESVLDNLDHPMIITNHFKKVLYLNKMALEMLQEDALGGKMASILKEFRIEINGDRMFVTKDDMTYYLIINNSSTKNFSYIIYQFFAV